MILVTGATGRVGSEVVAGLRGNGSALRAFVRSEPCGTTLGPADEVVVGDLDDPTAVAGAVSGVDSLFLVTPATPDQPDRERRLLDAAVSAGVGRVVKLSVLGASPDAPFRFGRNHAVVEDHLRDLPVDWTILRPNRFFSTILANAASIADHGLFHGCQGTAPVSLVDVRDIARVAVLALSGDRLSGAAVGLTGPEALTFDEQAAILSRSLGREIRYVDLGPEELGASLRRVGVSDWFAAALVELGLFYKAGGAAEVTGSIPHLTGTGPRTFAEWCQDNRDRFGPQPR
jgi:uncharacterized protein YbjT (DUF2867 family)